MISILLSFLPDASSSNRVNLARGYLSGFLMQDLRMLVPAGYPLRFFKPEKTDLWLIELDKRDHHPTMLVAIWTSNYILYFYNALDMYCQK